MAPRPLPLTRAHYWRLAPVWAAPTTAPHSSVMLAISAAVWRTPTPSPHHQHLGACTHCMPPPLHCRLGPQYRALRRQYRALRRQRRQRGLLPAAHRSQPPVRSSPYAPAVNPLEAHPPSQMAKDKRNFQGCPICISLKSEIQKAQVSGSRSAWEAARAKLGAHRQLTRSERNVYYHKRWCARQEHSGKFSLIFDKWSSNTTICPFLYRPVVSAWQSLKALVLRQHVMLVLCHAPGRDLPYFFTSNESVKGGANFNVECVRRALLKLSKGGPLPPVGYFQADSATDNKCHTMLYFLGMLVQFDMLEHAALLL